MMLISMTCVVLFAAGYVVSVYSWPSIKIWCNELTAEAGRLRNRAAKLKAKLGGIR